MAARRVVSVSHEINRVDCPTSDKPTIDKITEKAGLTNRKSSAGLMAKYAAPEVKTASRTLGFALTLDDCDGWAMASKVFADRLSPSQLAGLAWAAMRALEPEQADKVAETVLGDGEMPANLLGTIFGQATFWAQRATRSELKSYAAASFRAMSRHDRADFLRFAQGSART